MSLIQLKDVYKIYAEGQENQVNALDGVTLSIDQGEFVAIIGTSGSGKSTMMNILGCLDVPTRGEYLLDGTPIRERTQRELSQIRSRQIAFIFQGYNLIPSLNVWQNVALPMPPGIPPPKSGISPPLKSGISPPPGKSDGSSPWLVVSPPFGAACW